MASAHRPPRPAPIIQTSTSCNILSLSLLLSFSSLLLSSTLNSFSSSLSLVLVALDESRSTPVDEDVEERHVGDLSGATISEADLKLDEVYGDHVHGGITDDTIWQSYWRRLIVSHCRQYSIPNRMVGHRFLGMLTEIIEGIISRKWNSERWIVFQVVTSNGSDMVRG